MSLAVCSQTLMGIAVPWGASNWTICQISTVIDRTTSTVGMANAPSRLSDFSIRFCRKVLRFEIMCTTYHHGHPIALLCDALPMNFAGGISNCIQSILLPEHHGGVIALPHAAIASASTARGRFGGRIAKHNPCFCSSRLQEKNRASCGVQRGKDISVSHSGIWAIGFWAQHPKGPQSAQALCLTFRFRVMTVMIWHAAPAAGHPVQCHPVPTADPNFRCPSRQWQVRDTHHTDPSRCQRVLRLPPCHGSRR